MQRGSLVGTALLLMLIAGCDRGFESAALHAAWKPPNGIALEREVPGPHPRAEFSHGVVLQAIDDLPAGLEDPDAMGLQARKSAGLPDADSVDCKAGTLPAGPVIRCEGQRGSDHQMTYVVLVKGRTLVLEVAGPESTYGPLSAKVEGSLSSLRVR